MASAGQKKTTFLSQKLTFLKDQGGEFISAFWQHLNVIIEAGESWTEGGDNMRYLEICQMIDTAVVFMCERSEELAGVLVGPAANQLSQSSCKQPQTTSQPLTARSYGQPAAPFTSTATTFDRQPTEPVQLADETLWKTALARISVIEGALSDFRSNVGKVAEQHSGIDQQLKELLSKLSESDKKYNSRLRKVKEQISEISDTQSALNQEQETRLQSLEKQLQTLSTAQGRMEAEMESQAEMTEKLVHVPDQLESVKENLDVLDARIGRIMDDCNNKHQVIEHVTRDLADKVKANTDTVQVMSEGQDQKTTLMKELEIKLQIMEANTRRNVKDVQKQAEKGETNLRMLCQILNHRLTPLEQLRTFLNQRASTRDENIKKLSHVIQEVAVMSPRLQQLEVKSSRTRCGFTAWTGISGLATGATIRPYTVLDCNVGGNFDTDSGIFTAPVDGLYVASISLYLYGNETVGVDVTNNKHGQCFNTRVFWSSAEVRATTTCRVGVVDMKAGDTLFSHVYHNGTDHKKTVYFSCFLLT